MQPALFLDRDGVIVDEAEYLADPAQLRLFPGSAEAIAEVNRQGVLVVVVTNQSGVARGYFPESRVTEIHEQLNRLLVAKTLRPVVDRTLPLEQAAKAQELLEHGEHFGKIVLTIPPLS